MYKPTVSFHNRSFRSGCNIGKAHWPIEPEDTRRQAGHPCSRWRTLILAYAGCLIISALAARSGTTEIPLTEDPVKLDLDRCQLDACIEAENDDTRKRADLAMEKIADTSGSHLVVFPDVAFVCIAHRRRPTERYGLYADT